MVFLLGTEIISVFDRQCGSRVAVIRNTALDFDWKTLRHDLRGGHLLASSLTSGSGCGYLFWTPRYSDALRGSMKGAVLVTDEDREVENMSFQNGQVVFAVRVRSFLSFSLTSAGKSNAQFKTSHRNHEPFRSVILLHLEDWDPAGEFKRPKLHIISACCPGPFRSEIASFPDIFFFIFTFH
jgi:hypothetical protein